MNDSIEIFHLSHGNQTTTTTKKKKKETIRFKLTCLQCSKHFVIFLDTAYDILADLFSALSTFRLGNQDYAHLML